MRFCPQCERRFDDAVERCPDDGERTLASPTSALSALLGRVLDGRWRVGQVLGEGGMGAVFEGVQVNLERPVAIKVLQPNIADSEKVIGRFFREARVLSTLQHPHIVTILDFGQEEDTGLLYLVMERLQGEPLSEWMLRADVDVASVLLVVEHIASALVEAHRLGIVHRDLKPQNVFVTPVASGLHVKVLDFGIAKVEDTDAIGTLTRTGSVEGTPHYMAPEQIQGGELGPHTDLYALGGILYELLAARPPFDAEGLMAILMQHCNAPVPPLADRWALREAPSAPLIELTERLLAKAPADRPPSAADVLSTVKILRADHVPGAQSTGAIISETLDVPRELIPRHTPSGDERAVLETARHAAMAPPSPELPIPATRRVESSQPAAAVRPSEPVIVVRSGISPAALVVAAAIVVAGVIVAVTLASSPEPTTEAANAAPATVEPETPASDAPPAPADPQPELPEPAVGTAAAPAESPPTPEPTPTPAEGTESPASSTGGAPGDDDSEAGDATRTPRRRRDARRDKARDDTLTEQVEDAVDDAVEDATESAEDRLLRELQRTRNE